MRMPRVRFTVRRTMAVVGVAAAVEWMVVTALNIRNDPACRWVVHKWVREDDPNARPRPTTVTPCLAPFWPQYWRKLSGRPWPGTFACGCSDGGKALLSTSVGVTEPLRHTLVGSRAASSEEAGQIEASLRSLKRIGAPLNT